MRGYSVQKGLISNITILA